MVEQNITTAIVNKKTQFKRNLIFADMQVHLLMIPAHVNMYHKNWEDRPETLPYLIYISERFRDNNGDFYVLKINNVIKAISAYKLVLFDTNVAMAGIRSWIDPVLRAKMYIGHLPSFFTFIWAKEKDLKTILLSFNGYNKRLMNYFKRRGMGVPKQRNETRLFNNGVHEVPSVDIQYTEQWVLYPK